MPKWAIAMLLGGGLILVGATASNPDKELRELNERVRRIEDSLGRTALQPIGPSIQRQLQELRGKTESLERDRGQLTDLDDDAREVRRRFDALDQSLSDQKRNIEALQRDRSGRDTVRELQGQLRDLQRQLERIENRVRALERRRP